MKFRSGKEARVLIGSAEIPIISAQGNMTAATVHFVHSMSGGGTDVDSGIKGPGTATIVMEHDFENDPMGTPNIKAGTKLASLKIYPLGGTAEAPTGAVHTFNNFHVTTQPFAVEVAGKPGFQFSGECSTRDYSYTPETPPSP